MTQRPKLWPFWLPWQVEKHCVPVSFSNPFSVIACVASVSCEFIDKVGTRAKKRNDGGGGGNACPQTPPFWKSLFTHKCSSWLVQCWYCRLTVINTSLKTWYVLFTCVTDLVWSDLWLQIKMLWTDIYLNHVCAKVYQWRPIYWEWQHADLTGKMDCLSEIT